MGKGAREKKETPVRRVKKDGVPFTFLGITFEHTDRKTAYNHILLLAVAAILAKPVIAFITTGVFHSFVDLFDIGWYLNQGALMAQGQIPYVSFDFVYPILLVIPIVIALAMAFLTNSSMVFVFTFQALMILCDIVTVICIYLIGLKLWNERTAFLSGLVYAAAFSSAYFVITKYDAFPTCLLMLAILFTVYRKEITGYAASIVGFFSKVFPILALPFLILYNAKETSLKEEIIRTAKVAVPAFLILFLPLALFNPNYFRVYLPIRSELGYYSNTATFAIYSWLHDVLNIGISLDLVSTIMYIGMIAGLLFLVYAAYIIPDRDPVLLIKLILCAIVLVVVCARVRSPQYIVWFTPLLCILAVDDLKKIAALFVFQGLAYIEFPLMFGAFYTAVEYTDPVLSSGWIITLIMFTLEYLALFVCLWLVVSPIDIYHRIRTTGKPGVREDGV